jgi:hypothetical protein
VKVSPGVKISVSSCNLLNSRGGSPPGVNKGWTFPLWDKVHSKFNLGENLTPGGKPVVKNLPLNVSANGSCELPLNWTASLDSVLLSRCYLGLCCFPISVQSF